MKNLKLFALIACLLALTTSCLDDKEDTAKATVSYYGNLYSVELTADADSVFLPLLPSAFNKLGLISLNSAFEETAQQSYGTVETAVVMCNIQAIETYKKKLSGYSLEQVKSAMFTENVDSLAKWGYSSLSDVNLQPFQGIFLLQSARATAPIDTIKVLFE